MNIICESRLNGGCHFIPLLSKRFTTAYIFQPMDLYVDGKHMCIDTSDQCGHNAPQPTLDVAGHSGSQSILILFPVYLYLRLKQTVGGYKEGLLRLSRLTQKKNQISSQMRAVVQVDDFSGNCCCRILSITFQGTYSDKTVEYRKPLSVEATLTLKVTHEDYSCSPETARLSAEPLLTSEAFTHRFQVPIYLGQIKIKT